LDGALLARRADRGPGHFDLAIPCNVELEGHPEPGTMDTARFEALAGNGTRFVAPTIFQTGMDRDGRVEAGMRRGVDEGHERLTAGADQEVDSFLPIRTTSPGREDAVV
jgi:hypothetical protein